MWCDATCIQIRLLVTLRQANGYVHKSVYSKPLKQFHGKSVGSRYICTCMLWYSRFLVHVSMDYRDASYKFFDRNFINAASKLDQCKLYTCTSSRLEVIIDYQWLHCIHDDSYQHVQLLYIHNSMIVCNLHNTMN